jgi:hypothetical protein
MDMKTTRPTDTYRETTRTAEHNARKRRADHLKALVASNAVRVAAVNAAIESGAVLRVTTGAFGDFDVAYVREDFTAVCFPPGSRDSLRQRTFCFHSGHLPEWEQKLGIAGAANVD